MSFVQRCWRWGSKLILEHVVLVLCNPRQQIKVLIGGAAVAADAEAKSRSNKRLASKEALFVSLLHAWALANRLLLVSQ